LIDSKNQDNATPIGLSAQILSPSLYLGTLVVSTLGGHKLKSLASQQSSDQNATTQKSYPFAQEKRAFACFTSPTNFAMYRLKVLLGAKAVRCFLETDWKWTGNA
jgi:hypothetical protein